MNHLAEEFMQSNTQTAPTSKKMLWTGRIISALPVLFLLMDGVMKLFKPRVVVEATVQLGYPESVIVGLGIVLITCTVLYIIPHTRSSKRVVPELAFRDNVLISLSFTPWLQPGEENATGML